MAAPFAPDLVVMTAGDARAWDAVQRWRAAEPAGSSWWGRLSSLAMSGLRLLPGAGLVDDLVLGTVTAGLRDAGVRLGWMIAGSPDHVVTALAAIGHAVEVPADLRRLDVDDLRAARASLTRLHVGAAGLRGGLTGAAAGAAAGASGAATGVVAALAAAALDTVLAAATCTRAVARVALHYGYDPAEPAERDFALAVLAAGLSADPARAVAVLPTGMCPGFTHPAHCEIARGMPALGTGLGVVLSSRQIARVLETAEHLYTERFLREKYGDALAEVPAAS
ncbi:EcsC family protein [Actinomycetospora endophytica]|uniref:EcsC family protein n=1 Tax=Actinomycetospora endophytica TaxID=2291215 RepID=A0ABS8P650_9PSEU|nr:EcsC family protein [Actinomycetospora endophytica]MCD2193025.1 EcsC family protein [Actinomycetospora endophytica]